MPELRLRIRSHFRENAVLYAFMLVVFGLGVVLGILGSSGLDDKQVQNLAHYLELLIENSQQELPNSYRLFQRALTINIQSLAAIWLLGLTVIGLPLIGAVIMARGFVLGFSTAFLVSQGVGVGGGWAAAVCILPQHLIYVPVLVAAGVRGTLFSLSLTRSAGWRSDRQSTWLRFWLYCLFTGILGALLGIGAWIEGYVSPWLFKLLLP